jgi:3-methyladenine DNA glycosylase AlkC
MILKEIYNQHFFELFSASIIKFQPNFNQKEFLSLASNSSWKQQELKQRMNLISKSLHQNLGENFEKNILILKKVACDVTLPNHLIPGLSLVVLANYVENFGLDNFEISLDALEYFTKFGSSEFAIRPFLIRYEKETLKKLWQFSKSNNYHVRRLASEGSRPRLPWGIGLPEFKKNPALIIPILENLLDDPQEYVRRSVANNLNDICKDNPDIALNLARKWLNKNEHRQKLVSHGIRTMLKKGDQKALKLFGFHSAENYSIEKFIIKKPAIKIGENLEFSFSLEVTNPSKIRLEYVIYFLRKDQKFSKKIFQITQKTFDCGNFIFQKRHSFRIITTKKYYAGIQQIGLVINGKEVNKKEFKLEIY